MAKGITRAQIVQAALAVLDEGGIDAVTVRAVAARLGIRAPALYWHVRDKQELLDEMGTEIHRRVGAAILEQPLDSDRTAGLARYARTLRAEYLAHRDGARTFSGTRLTDPSVLAGQEAWLQAWIRSGVDISDAIDAGELVTAFVVGFVIEEQERLQSGDNRYSLAQRDAALSATAPLVAASAHGRGSSEERFERQLAMVLEGLARRLRGE